jgi:hypothetical protein
MSFRQTTYCDTTWSKQGEPRSAKFIAGSSLNHLPEDIAPLP